MGKNVKLSSVTKKFGEFTAVNKVSLLVNEGELLTFLGPSGSGKTTLLLLIAGFHEITSGEIFIGEEPMVFVNPNKRNIGMVFQSYSLFPHMTIFDNIAFPLKVRGMDKTEIFSWVRKSLELVKLEGYESRYPNQLSGGQQQRVALARALIFDPSILLMDEPLGALDKKLRDYMQLEIKRIHEALNATIIYVTHDQEEALTISDRIAVMNEGRIEQADTPEQLYEAPASTFVANFIGESNIISGKIIRRNASSFIMTNKRALEIEVPIAEGCKAGSQVDLVIRPERIFFTNKDTGIQKAFRGIIEEKIYVGEIIKYMIRLDGGELLTVKKQNTPELIKADKGEIVCLQWNPSDVKIFPKA